MPNRSNAQSQEREIVKEKRTMTRISFWARHSITKRNRLPKRKREL